jgi:acyl-CoA synthetase (AMP-forming)/AMP-acid ligase II
MVFELFRAAAYRHRDELAIVDGDQRITYGDLLERVSGMREWLRNTLDPKAGEVIAASLSNTWQFVASFFAVSELGAVFMPCNPQWRAEELRWFTGRLRFRGVITEAQFRADWGRIGDVILPESVLTVGLAASRCESAAALNPLPSTKGSEDDPALYLATSGSTGVPRVVPRTHRNLEVGSRNVARALGIGPGRRFLSVVPFFHSNGFHNCMLMPLVSGATLVLMPQFSPAACHELIDRERVDILIGSPFIYGVLADSVADPGLMSTLQFCFSAGARMPAAVSQRWIDRFGIRARQWYGMSETHAIAIDRAREEPGSGPGTSVGTPIPGVEVKVLDAKGTELACGAVGELAVRSQAVMSGYFSEPELNKQVFHDGFFRTGDFGYLDAAGNLYLAGRKGRVINMAGVKIDPVEIEQAVEALLGVSACRVDAVPNGREGEVIRARVVTRPGFDITRRAVIAQCREHLAEYKLPRIIEFAEALPTLVAGKMPVEWTHDKPAR